MEAGATCHAASAAVAADDASKAEFGENYPSAILAWRLRIA
jgi:hypothetical protein